MSGILEMLKEELKKSGKELEIREKTLEISSTDVMQLNNEIERFTQGRREMLNQSLVNAARFPITK